ncbi:MAG: ABC transporter ATP-binding protein [Candidatus Caldarchaeum sp.]|nr:ABC transporter ATP-binding protein [Candidatus Caldarchaeales archaeon]
MEILRVEHLVKRFGGIVAVDDVSFAVKKNEILGVIGPNGAGKTTLFSLISGTEKPDAGKVYLNGEDITATKPYHRALKGLVRTFQIVRPFKSLTVEQNLRAPLTVRGNKFNEEEAMELLRQLGLATKRNTPTTLLTHGELKKLEVARGLIAKPRVLMLDEPFGGLTVAEIEEVTQVLKGYLAEGGTLIIIEHRLRELMKLIQRALVMDQGKLIFEGAPADVARSEVVIKAYLGTNTVI